MLILNLNEQRKVIFFLDAVLWRQFFMDCHQGNSSIIHSSVTSETH